MKNVLLLIITLALPLCAQVKFTRAADSIDIQIDGKPFSTLFIGGDAPKPYLAPLRTADGLVITRRYPMAEVAGESHDHPHHRGLWFTHGDVNQIDFWMNERGATGRHGTIQLDKLQELKGGSKQGTIHLSFIWNSDTGTPLLKEDRLMTFLADPTLRIVDFDVTFTALETAKFGDTKEGFFAIRLRDELSETKGTGLLTNAEGKTGMKQVWGKPSPWVDYSGTLEGKKVGLAIFDYPGTYGFPIHWHARDYGLFAANPFGLHDFYNDKTKDGSYTLGEGKAIHFRFRVVIHPGDTASAGIARMYADWTKDATR